MHYSFKICKILIKCLTSFSNYFPTQPFAANHFVMMKYIGSTFTLVSIFPTFCVCKLNMLKIIESMIGFTLINDFSYFVETVIASSCLLYRPILTERTVLTACFNYAVLYVVAFPFSPKFQIVMQP